MPRRVFVHVGCPKTGTSYLQGVLWANKPALLEAGLLVPAEVRHHYATTLVVRETVDTAPDPDTKRRRHAQLMAEVDAHDGDVVLTHEMIAAATAAQAKRFLGRFAPAEVHVVITARDFARQLPAEWQQHVKAGGSTDLPTFVDNVRHRRPGSAWFWSVQDVPDLAGRWGATLPADRVHVVTVPSAETSGPSALWNRFAAVLGVDPTAYSTDVQASNESLGAVEVELLRRVNPYRRRLFAADKDWVKRRLSDDVLAQREDAQRFAYDPALQPWVVETSQQMVERLRATGYDVVGDLDDLLAPAAPVVGVDPTSVTSDQLLEVSLDALAQVMVRARELEQANRRLRRQAGAASATQKALRRLRRVRRWLRRR